MSDGVFQSLLTRTAAAASNHRRLMEECGQAFIERYGVHYSECDADSIIEVLDLNGGKLTVAECDEEMTRVGYPPKAVS